MSIEVFSIADLSFSVFQDTDGSLRWEGDYRGLKVIAALPVYNGSRCLILQEITASTEPTFENLLCVERDGDFVWKAELLQTNDAFVSFPKNSEEWVCQYIGLDTDVELDAATESLLIGAS